MEKNPESVKNVLKVKFSVMENRTDSSEEKVNKTEEIISKKWKKIFKENETEVLRRNWS